MSTKPELPSKIRVSIANVRFLKGQKRPTFDIAIFAYPVSEPNLVIFRRPVGVNMNPASPNYVGNKLEEPLRSHVITFINGLKASL
jgi:hypothetical protein